MNESIKDYGKRLLDGLTTIDQNLVDEVYTEIYQRINSHNTIHFLGNGGSQANAHHIVGDYTKTFSIIGKSININSLSDNSCYLTAVSNDLDYSAIYELLISTRVKANDLVIFFSGSGNSLNLVKCARKAKNSGINQAAIVGFTGGALKKIVNFPVHVEFDDMEISEDIQLSIFHYIKQMLMVKYADIFCEVDITKYRKRTSEDLIS